ncbi:MULTISPECIES: TolC family protein [unclassified Yoonia]|uniref:TolC family protein n=1 Tax=unclassified Yoonia TaxID=2629118 RepID=UPI002AFEF5E4|nr:MULTISPECIES: TolC family protein [unclassified Yoonia]
MTQRNRNRALGPAVILLGMTGCTAPMGIAQMQLAMVDRLDSISSIPAPQATAPATEFRPALRAAVLADPAYIAAKAEETAALAQIGVAASLRQPQLVGSLDLGTTMGDQAARSGATAGLVLSQIVYDGGALVAGVNRVTAQALAAREGRIAAGNDSALAAATLWITLWHYQARATQMQTRSANMARLVAQIARMADNGLLDQAALAQAQRQVIDMRLEEERLQEAAETARRDFARRFPAQAGVLPAPDRLLDDTAAAALAKNAAKAPIMQQQVAALFAAEAALAEAEANSGPRARLQLAARGPEDRATTPDLSLGLRLDYTLGDGGRAERQLAAATARVAADQARLDQIKDGLAEALQAELSRLSAIDRALQLSAEKLRLSRAEAEAARAQLQTGGADLRELIDAELAIYGAQDQQLALRAEYEILLLAIAARTGGLSTLIALEDAANGTLTRHISE